MPAAIGIYNAVTALIMAEHGIATDDLYAAVLARQAELQNPLDVHFNSKGCDVLAAHVAAAISAALPPVKK